MSARPLFVSLTVWFVVACGPTETTSGAGGAPATGQGGASSGGVATGGATTSGGTVNTQGGNVQGGAAPTFGGNVSGGAASGGSANGGSTIGVGGASQGGANQGGATARGGAGGALGGSSALGGAGMASTGGASSCGNAVFCEDFEKLPVGEAFSAPLMTQKAQGTVAIDTTRHFSGTKAVKFTTMAGANTKTAYLRVQGSTVFPITGNLMYGRMMFYLESAPTTDVHWTIVQGGGLVPNQTYRALYRYGGQKVVNGGNQWMANYETPDSYSGKGPSTDCWLHANGRTVPTGKWTCLEWKFDGPMNQMRIWLDGAAADDLSMNGTGQGCLNQGANYTWTAPNFEYVDVGWEAYQQDQARTLYIDDLAIGKERLMCPSAAP